MITHKSIIPYIAKLHNISQEQAANLLYEMTFSEYIRLLNEEIVPPSGKPISPSTNKPNQANQQETNTQSTKNVWPGGNAPITPGMVINSVDDNGNPIQQTVSQVDKNANGVKIKDPVTGKEQWSNINDLNDLNIQRLQELAGIGEDGSSGGTSSGGIATSVHTLETIKKEYTPKQPAKTIIGDTKPNQATGELSATLAANGKKTASRKNNGIKK